MSRWLPVSRSYTVGQCLGEAVLAGPDVVLAGVVGAVGEHSFRSREAGLVHHVDALQQVCHGLAAHRRSGLVTLPSL